MNFQPYSNGSANLWLYHTNFVKIQHDVIQNLGTFLIILQALTCNIL